MASRISIIYLTPTATSTAIPQTFKLLAPFASTRLATPQEHEISGLYCPQSFPGGLYLDRSQPYTSLDVAQFPNSAAKMNADTPSGNFLSLPGLKRKEVNQNKELRLPLIGFLPNKIRNHFIAMCGEFVGTFLFLFFAFAATQVANQAATGSTTSGANSSGGTTGSISQVPNASTLLYISLAFGFSLAVNAWVFFRISGGLFNPAVTLGMALIGAVPWVRAGLVFIAQILGAMASAAVVSALFPSALNVSTTLGGDTSIARGLFIEMFLTAELVFTIFMLAAEKHKGTFLAPIGIGLALFIAELAGVYFTGGSLNPARSFGPCVVLHSFPGYHWIYWLGPALGSILAVLFYRFIKVLEYETANPCQDFDEKEQAVYQHDEDSAATAADVARPTVSQGQPDYIDDGSGHYISNPSSPRLSPPNSAGLVAQRTINSLGNGNVFGPNGNGAGKTAMERPHNPTMGSEVRKAPATDAPFNSARAMENGGHV
ncbi:aquaporin-like protein [Teratosphaeria nubilosa]|uniref:Aquaporin-like protein n=1 Tax=Teratosphaeria nubilosa TaxID=161662 RepID=A0A6G1LNG6_9PEZI|nr:aquaporin-like protein [Teratosphaeria nubilosa]